MTRLLLGPLLLLSSAMSGGCGVQTIYATANTPVRLAEDVKASIYVKDPQTGNWVKGQNRVSLPAGGYYVPPSAVHPTTQPSKPSH